MRIPIDIDERKIKGSGYHPKRTLILEKGDNGFVLKNSEGLVILDASLICTEGYFVVRDRHALRIWGRTKECFESVGYDMGQKYVLADECIDD
jgi:hypothetical protein